MVLLVWSVAPYMPGASRSYWTFIPNLSATSMRGGGFLGS